MIRWINESKGLGRDERGNYRSVEGRFVISPTYRHTVNPDSYRITDYMALREYVNGKPVCVFKDRSFDTIRECKQWAAHQLEKII